MSTVRAITNRIRFAPEIGAGGTLYTQNVQKLYASLAMARVTNLRVDVVDGKPSNRQRPAVAFRWDVGARVHLQPGDEDRPTLDLAKPAEVGFMQDKDVDKGESVRHRDEDVARRRVTFHSVYFPIARAHSADRNRL